MKATADLKEEHGGVKVMLGILEKVCDRLETGKSVDPQHLPQILEFLGQRVTQQPFSSGLAWLHEQRFQLQLRLDG